MKMDGGQVWKRGLRTILFHSETMQKTNSRSINGDIWTVLHRDQEIWIGVRIVNFPPLNRDNTIFRFTLFWRIRPRTIKTWIFRLFERSSIGISENPGWCQVVFFSKIIHEISELLTDQTNSIFWVGVNPNVSMLSIRRFEYIGFFNNHARYLWHYAILMPNS
jgi:hypothetical protein